MNSLLAQIKKYHESLLLGLFIFIAFFYGLGSYALENVNEGLYGEIPREMLLSGNFVIPHLNFVPYIEKPPLLYWLTAFSYYLFGISEFSARLIPALSATVVVVSVYHFINHTVKKSTGLLAALMLTTSVAFILVARVIIFDMLLCACFTMCLLSFYRWYQSNNKTHLRIAYSALALAVLTKGLLPLALLPAIALLFFTCERPGWGKFKEFLDPVGIAIFLLIAIPWHVVASLQLHDFAWQYFMNEHVLRFLNKRIPNDYHHGSWYFYLPRLLLYIAPWSLFAPLLAVRVTELRSLQRFLWCWFLVPLVFFSISQAKGDYYMIIALPALVMLLSLKMQHYFTTKSSRAVWWLFALTVMLELILFATLTLGAYQSHIVSWLPDRLQLESFLAKPMLQLLVTTCVIAVTGFILQYRYRHHIMLACVLFASLMLAPVQFLVTDKQLLQANHSTVFLADIIKQYPETKIYLYRDFEELSTLIFYTQQRITLVDSISSDLYFGSHQPDARSWFINRDSLRQELQQGRAFIVTKSGNVEALRAALDGINLQQLQSGRTVLLTH